MKLREKSKTKNIIFIVMLLVASGIILGLFIVKMNTNYEMNNVDVLNEDSGNEDKPREIVEEDNSEDNIPSVIPEEETYSSEKETLPEVVEIEEGTEKEDRKTSPPNSKIDK